MQPIAAHLRCLQLFTHNAHNIVKGAVFFQDHEFLGETYPVYESDYDSVVERIIGLSDMKMEELLQIQMMALQKLKTYSMNQPDNKSYLNIILQMEKELCSLITSMIADKTEGTKQMLGDICDRSEVRQYKLRQRCR
jgi:DNA-binding ferritin-like protein